jgi:hypothetical protein
VTSSQRRDPEQLGQAQGKSGHVLADLPSNLITVIVVGRIRQTGRSISPAGLGASHPAASPRSQAAASV